MEHRQVISALPPGTALARYIQTLCQAKGDARRACDISEGLRDTPAVYLTHKAFVDAMSTGTTGSLMTYGVAQELVALVRGVSILGKLQDRMRRVPFRTKLGRETTGAQSSWVGEGGPKPLSSMALDTLTMESDKSISMIVLTSELIKQSKPSAEQVVKTSMVQGVAAHLDDSFLDPLIDEIPNVRPASITNGTTPVVSTGSTAAQINTDLTAMMAALESWGYPVWVMKPSTAAALAGKTNTSGNPQFPNITVLAGGTLFGIPVITSTNSPAQITLIDAADVLLADDGETEISFAKDASVLMDDQPELSPRHSSLVSLYQRDLVGILSERWIAWLRGHDTSVTYMLVSY